MFVLKYLRKFCVPAERNLRKFYISPARKFKGARAFLKLGIEILPILYYNIFNNRITRDKGIKNEYYS